MLIVLTLFCNKVSQRVLKLNVLLDSQVPHPDIRILGQPRNHEGVKGKDHGPGNLIVVYSEQKIHQN